MRIQGQDRPAQYLVRNRKSGVYLGDVKRGEITIELNPGTHTHVIESGSDRAIHFTLAQADELCRISSGLCEYCPITPATCDWM